MQQSQKIDLDLYGRTSTNGQPLVHSGDYAISNAIVLYLNSNRGDFLYQPNYGGAMAPFVFKNMTDKSTSKLKSNLERDLSGSFGKLVSGIEVEVTAEKENRILDVEVYYTSIESGQTNSAGFTVGEKTIRNAENDPWIRIRFTGDNLIAFMVMKKPDYPNSQMTFDSPEQKWVWGPYLFTNLSSTDPDFEEIQSIANE
jgi:phage baseplate assembly protein W